MDKDGMGGDNSIGCARVSLDESLVAAAGGADGARVSMALSGPDGSAVKNKSGEASHVICVLRLVSVESGAPDGDAEAETLKAKQEAETLKAKQEAETLKAKQEAEAKAQQEADRVKAGAKPSAASMPVVSGRLQVMVTRAEGLAKGNDGLFGGSPDPYVKVECSIPDSAAAAAASSSTGWRSIGTGKTKHVSNSTEPRWPSAELSIGSSVVSVGGSAGHVVRIRLELFDYDMFSKDDLLAAAQIDLRAAKGGGEWMSLGQDASGLEMEACWPGAKEAGKPAPRIWASWRLVPK
jgi:hypothetical protein